MTHEQSRIGRPRSEQARTAVLHAVDDLLVEQGYAAMTMKGIAQRAGVGRQTVYRWWSTKAEILLEACVLDARDELATTATGDPRRDLTRYVRTLLRFLKDSAAGAAYRALIGEAQHDDAVAQLLATQDVLTESARTILQQADDGPSHRSRSSRRRLDDATALLVGPVLAWVLIGRDPAELTTARIVESVLAVASSDAG